MKITKKMRKKAMGFEEDWGFGDGVTNGWTDR